VTIDRPLSVNRVMPPITTMAKIRPQQAISHQPTARRPARGVASA